MKFHQLRVGERFRFQGTNLRKVSPLQAVAEDDAEGRQRLVPRSADVAPLGGADAGATPGSAVTLAPAARDELLTEIEAACVRAAASAEPPLTERQRLHLLRAVRDALAGSDPD